MEKEYTYSAFISYSSKDEKVAKALWKKLEHYRLPSVLQKQYEDIPEKMHIFLDQGDIVPGDTVENALSRELADSKKLIVICSHNSAKSPYVELEVKNFLSLGHSPNDIIPYIIEGEVNRNSPNNCYVPSLFGKTDKETINGVSVLRDGKWKAFVGVLANLLDVKFDEIYRREKVRRNRINAALSGLGLLFACFIGFAIWYMTPHTKYYADYVTKWGIPEGIRELDKKARKQYPYHYKITFKAFRPVKLIHVNVKGTPVPETDYDEHQNRPRIAEYTYYHPFRVTHNKQKWDLNEVLYYYDSNLSDGLYIPIYKMRLVYTELSPFESYVDFYFDSDDKKQKNLSNNILSSQNFYFSDVPILSSAYYEKEESPDYVFFKNSSSISRFRIFYETDGLEQKVTFFNKNNHSAHDSNGINGYLLTHDDKGRIIKERYLYDENNFYGFKNINTKIMEYDENDHLTKTGFYYINPAVENTLSEKTKKNTKNEILTLNKSRSFSEKCIKWEKNKKELKQIIKYYNSEDKKSDDPCNIIEKTFDSKGIEKHFLSSSSNETTNEEIIKINKQGLKEDSIEIVSKDSVIEQYNYHFSYVKVNDIYMKNIIILKDNNKPFLSIDLKSNTENNKLEIIKYCVNESGDVIESQKYDEYGRYVENLITDKNMQNTSAVKIIYKGDNRSINYFVNDEYSLSPNDNYVRADFAYNNDGMLTYVCFKDSEGKNVDNKILGFSTYCSIYSPNALLLFEEYVDSEGIYKIPNEGTYARYIGKNDLDDKVLISGSWFDIYGNLANQKYNHFDSKYNDKKELVINYYDTNNFIVRELFYKDDIIEKVTSNWQDDEGHHKVTYNFDGVPLSVETKKNKNEKYWDYENGYIISYREYTDKKLECKTNFELEEGVLVSDVINYSDGSKINEYYEDGNCIHFIKTLKDGSVAEEWFAEYKDEKMVHLIQELYDGQKNEDFYEDGECIHHISFSKDGSKEREWFKEFQAGKLIYDLDYTSDGRKAERWYENEKVVHRIVWDKSGNKEHEYFWNYSENNLRYFKCIDLDGTILEEDYKDGKFYHSVKTYKDGRKEEKYY